MYTNPQGFAGYPQTAHPLLRHPHVMTYEEVPTVKYIENDPLADAQALRKAMKGLGTDEEAIINILAWRTNIQREEIANIYKTHFGRDLIKDLKSEISGNFEDTIIALMTPPVEYLAKKLNKAMKGIGTREQTLIDILCTSSNEEIRKINATYEKLFQKKLESDIDGDTSGSFKKLLVSLNTAGRSEDPSAHPTLAAQDAKELYEAGEKRSGTEDSKFIEILGTRSFPQLRLIIREYQQLTDHSLETAIKKEFSGDIEMGLLAVVKNAKNRAEYFAERLHQSMVGLGTNDDDLIFIVVSRSEIDLENIKQQYAKLYRKPLGKDITEDTSGDYRRVLIALLGV